MLTSSLSSTSLTTTHSIVLTGLSAGRTYYYSVTSCDVYNNCAASSVDSFSTASGGGTSPGSSTPSEKKSINVFDVIEKGKVTEIKISDSEIGIRQIDIEVNNNANSVEITVTKLTGQPASITKTIEGKAYQYLEISTKNLDGANIKKAKIKFSVAKSWLTDNKYDAADVILKRFSNNEWQKLKTTKTGETANDINYEAETPGFSTFAITAEKAVVTPTAVCGNAICESGETINCPADCKTEEPAPPEGSVCGNSVCETGEGISCPQDCQVEQPSEPLPTEQDNTSLYAGIGIIILIIILGAGYFLMPKKKKR